MLKVAMHVYVCSGTYKDGKYNYSIVIPMTSDKVLKHVYDAFDRDKYGDKVGAIRAVTHTLRFIINQFGSSIDGVVFHCFDKDRHIKDWDDEEYDSVLAKGYKHDLETCRKLYQIDFVVEDSENADFQMQKAYQMVSEANAS